MVDTKHPHQYEIGQCHIIKKYFKKASENMDLSKNKKAIKYLDKILFLDKNNVDAIVSKGYCYACMYNKSESIKCLDLASKLLTDSDELLSLNNFPENIHSKQL